MKRAQVVHRAKLLLAGLLLILLGACNSSPDPEPTGTPAPTATAALVQLPTPTTPPTAEPTSTSLPFASPTLSAKATQIDAFLRGRVEVADFSGAVLVAHRGEVIFRGAYGYADAEAKVPNTPETRFQLASVSKAFAAMSIMILEERGVLSVQDPLCLYLTGCPPAWAGVRLHHLLTHTSGLPGDDIQVDLTFADLSYESAFALVRDRPLLFEPGSAYGYSNVGYIALGAVIERASGVGYAEFVRENIFTPLGISRSGAVGDGMALGTEAVGYNEPGVRTRYVVHPLIYAAGGLVSTVDDLFLWDRALYGETLIKRETLRRIFTPNMSDYGYGWAIERSAYGPRIGHSGNIEGFRTRIARYPDTQSTIIILSNYNRADVEGMVSEIESLLHK